MMKITLVKSQNEFSIHHKQQTNSWKRKECYLVQGTDSGGCRQFYSQKELKQYREYIASRSASHSQNTMHISRCKLTEQAMLNAPNLYIGVYTIFPPIAINYSDLFQNH